MNQKAEFKILQAANELKKARIVPTYLGAHAIPQPFSSEKKYLQSLFRDIETLHKKQLANRVDIFIEKGYFSCSGAKFFFKKKLRNLVLT